MELSIIGPAPVRGHLRVPADKAICHRIALLCAISRGTTEVSPWAAGAQDCQHTLELIERLGVPVAPLEHGVRIEGRGLDGLRAPAAALDCGESGTTMRLACGLLAGQRFRATLTGAASLRRRPMRRIIDPLIRMGAGIRGVESEAGEVYPPLAIDGRRPLQGLAYEMPLASAQVKSALLIAGLYAREPVVITEPAATRDHTERLLARLGAGVRVAGRQIHLEPLKASLISPSSLRIPGDFSSAAFFIVAASALPGSSLQLEDVGLNPTRTRLLDVLARMGASIERRASDDGWEPVGALAVRQVGLRGVTLEPGEAALVIDELPSLMVAACAAAGQTRFRGLQELRVKETDRIRSMVTGLRRLGAVIEEDGDDVTVSQSTLRGAVVDSFGDHRTAMSLAIAGLLAKGRTRIRGAECVGKSFREFFSLLQGLAGPDSVGSLAASA